MSYDTRTRDRYRGVVTGVTAAVGVGAFTVTGAFMGLAAAESGQEQQDQQPAAGAQQDQQRERARKPLKQRPYVTRESVRYVTGGAAPSSGGTVTTSSGSSGSSGSSSGSSGSGSSGSSASSGSGSSGSGSSGSSESAPSSGS